MAQYSMSISVLRSISRSAGIAQKSSNVGERLFSDRLSACLLLPSKTGESAAAAVGKPNDAAATSTGEKKASSGLWVAEESLERLAGRGSTMALVMSASGSRDAGVKGEEADEAENEDVVERGDRVEDEDEEEGVYSSGGGALVGEWWWD